MITTPISQHEIQAAFEDVNGQSFPPIMSLSQCASLFHVDATVVQGWIDSGLLHRAIATVGEVVLVWRDRAVAAVFESGQASASPTPTARRFGVRRINEEVTIYRRGKKGIYQAEMRHPPHRESLRTTSSREARRRASLLYRAGKYEPPPIPEKSMEAAMEEFLDTKKVETYGRVPP